jgi:hypothetical protein
MKVLEQQVLRKHESMKAKALVDWQTKEQMHDSFVHTIRELGEWFNITSTP